MPSFITNPLKFAMAAALTLTAAAAQESGAAVRFLEPAPAGYSNIVEVRSGRTIYLAGQVAMDKDGKLVGGADMAAQTRQVFENIKARLASVHATFHHVVKLNYYITDAAALPSIRSIRNEFINTQQPPASTLVVVKQLFRPEFLIEVEAVAVVPDGK